MSVGVVGAGVIGLTSALKLLESGSELKTLTILSEQFPQDLPVNHSYTSPWAGAHFRPFPHRDSDYESDKRESQYTRITFDYFKSKPSYVLKEATVEFMKGIDWIEQPSAEYKRLGSGYNGETLNDFSQETRNVPDGVRFSYSYETWCLNAPVYLLFLYKEITRLCEERSVKLRIKTIRLEKLSDIRELYPDIDVVINASGRGLQWDGGFDPDCFLVRGQTLLLDVGDRHDKLPYAQCTITHQGKSGDWTFVIKRPAKNAGERATYILGGTKQPGDYRIMPRDEDTQALLARGKKLYPDLLEQYEIKNVNVGFRPLRKGGSRVEIEFAQIPIIHAYGLGGMGFEASVGVAYHVSQLYDSLKAKPKL